MKKFLILLILAVLISGCISTSEGSSDLIGNCEVEADCDTASDSLCVDQCGNGLCDEFVCQGEGCPCAETIDSCPEDC